MPDEADFFKTADNFSLKSYACMFEAETLLDTNGVRNALTIRKDTNKTITYAFQGSGALCITNENGNPVETNLLEKFISIKDGMAKPTLLFFQKYGFLFPIPDDILEINLQSLTTIIERLKATTLLVTVLAQKTPNYKKLLELTLFLLFGEVTSFKYGNNEYTSHQSSLIKLLTESTIITNNNTTVSSGNEEYYAIPDMIYPKEYLLPAGEYEDITTGETFMYNYPGIKDSLYRKLVSLYKANNTKSKVLRLQIEFLFHFMHKVGIIKEASYNQIKYYAPPNYDNFDNRLKKALLLVAKIIVAEEINYNVSRVKPTYNALTLTPTWKAPTLLAALYFSCFYTNPNAEIHKRCENPSCTNYFKVKTTNSKRKYCCKNCRNAANQRAHRKKVK